MSSGSGQVSLAGAAALCVAGGVGGLVLGRWLGKEKVKKCDHPITEDVRSLARQNIRELEPYRCARDDYETGVLLDANENALGPALSGTESVAAAAAGEAARLNRYPDPYQRELKELIGGFRGVSHENIFVGVGSDEAIDLLFRVFCEPRAHNVVICPPTYGMYKVCAASNDVGVLKAPLEAETFDLDVEGVLKVVTPNTRLVFVTTPGNPTSRVVSRSRVLALLEKLPQSTLLVMDEAYIDFCEEPSLAPLVKRYSRLVVLHTLSKAFGLAGARVGTCIADAAVIQLMNNLKAPYNMNSLTSKVACAALADRAPLRAAVDALVDERRRLSEALAALPFVVKVYASDANFLLVKVAPADRVKRLYKTLADSGVVVRYRGDQLHCRGCLRVTVGTPRENDTLLAQISKIAPTVLNDHVPNGH